MSILHELLVYTQVRHNEAVFKCMSALYLFHFCDMCTDCTKTYNEWYPFVLLTIKLKSLSVQRQHYFIYYIELHVSTYLDHPQVHN
jgi:hypothetical protein